MRELIKKIIKDAEIEPYIRWFVKRSRGIKIPFDSVENEIYNRQATEVIERVMCHKSNAIDVGCHKGQFLAEFLKYAPQGCCFAFEPIPDLAAMLQSKFPSAKVYTYALSNERGETIFYIIPDSPALSGLNSRPFVAEGKLRQEIKVTTERLDAIIPKEVKIDLIKIDVEGAEGQVILGAVETIRQNRPYIIFEHGCSSSKPFGFSSSDIYDLLVERCDLKISLLKKWLHEEPSLSKREFIESNDWYFLAHRNG